MSGRAVATRDVPERREAFIEAYLGEARFNGSRAAQIAGYAVPAVEAVRLLRNDKVRARIKAVLDTRALTAEAVLAELAEIATADWREFLSIRRDRNGDVLEVKMDLTAKVKALELIGKAHRLFVDRAEVTGADGTPIEFTISIGDAHGDDRDS